jgi:hypothetical protein
MSGQPLDDYFAALERLKKGTSIIVSKGTKITNDAVALEAGRGKGSIKKSRPVFADLIAAIDEAAKTQASPVRDNQERLVKAKALAEDYRLKWEAALARELCLLRELAEVKKKLAQLTGSKILPIRGDSKPVSAPEFDG